MNFAELISSSRKKENLSQKELAEKLHVSEKTVSSWECGRNNMPNPSLFGNICNILDIPAEKLFLSIYTEKEWESLFLNEDFKNRYEYEFSSDGYFCIYNLVSEEEYREYIKDDLDFLIGMMPWKYSKEKMIDFDLEKHRSKKFKGMCWKNKLCLSPEELQVCLFYLKSEPYLDIFDLYKALILPRNLMFVRKLNTLKKKGVKDGRELHFTKS